MPFNLKFDGTPNSSVQSLCENCRWAQVVRGSNGQHWTICGYQTNHPIRMKVIDCNRHMEVNRQSLPEMERDAWILGTHKIVGLAGGRPEDGVKITWSRPEDRKDQTGEMPVHD